MRLTEAQKGAVIAAQSYPECQQVELVRVGDSWACAWRQPEAAVQARWRGQLVKEVVLDTEAEAFGIERYKVWWTGTEFAAPRRRDIIEALAAEAVS